MRDNVVVLFPAAVLPVPSQTCLDDSAGLVGGEAPEQGDADPLAAGPVVGAVHGAHVAIVGDSLQQIGNVDDKGAGDGPRVDPLPLGVEDLQPARLVLPEDGEEAEVGVRAERDLLERLGGRVRLRLGVVVEQQRRVRIPDLGVKVRLGQAERQGKGAREGAGEREHGLFVGDDVLLEPGHVRGRGPGKVDVLILDKGPHRLGDGRRVLVREGRVVARVVRPGKGFPVVGALVRVDARARVRHVPGPAGRVDGAGRSHLDALVLPEEVERGLVRVADDLLRHAVVGDVEEANVGGGGGNVPRDCLPIRERRAVDASDVYDGRLRGQRVARRRLEDVSGDGALAGGQPELDGGRLLNRGVRHGEALVLFLRLPSVSLCLAVLRSVLFRLSPCLSVFLSVLYSQSKGSPALFFLCRWCALCFSRRRDEAKTY